MPLQVAERDTTTTTTTSTTTTTAAAAATTNIIIIITSDRRVCRGSYKRFTSGRACTGTGLLSCTMRMRAVHE